MTAQSNLATLYFRGQGVPKDYSQAAVWFRAAADQGFAPAQDDLAWMYYTGIGVGQDYKEAAKWTRMAAEQGYASAQIDLGCLYEHGKGVPLDYVNAYVWYKMALAGGDQRGRKTLKSVSRLMTGDQIRIAEERAQRMPALQPQAPSTGDSNAFRNSFSEEH